MSYLRRLPGPAAWQSQAVTSSSRCRRCKLFRRRSACQHSVSPSANCRFYGGWSSDSQYCSNEPGRQRALQAILVYSKAWPQCVGIQPQTTAEPDHQSKSYEMAEFSRLLNFRCDNLGKESLFFLTFDDENQPGIHKVFHPTVVKYVYSSLFL